jgi:hypothetical protein
MPGKPTARELGIDLGSVEWRGSGDQPGVIQVAFVTAQGADWVLLRVLGGDECPVSVFSRFEWECFVDGAKKGEFDAAAARPGLASPS